MSLGPLGMNSGMDINSIVSKVVDAERVPKQQRIDNERADNDASISAYGRLRESLDTMKNLMMNFRQEKAFAARKVETTDDSVVSATATTDAIAGRYAVDVLQLAQSHKVASNVLAQDAKFGPGKLQIGLGNKSFTIDVQQNSKLIDVVRSINNEKSNPGVRASVINDVEGPRLIVAANKSGKDNALSISAQSQSPNDPLKKLEYKTLEARVRDIEKARAAAQELIAPLSAEQKALATEVAERIAYAAKNVDQELADDVAQEVSKVDPNGGQPKSPDADVSGAELQAAEQASQRYIKPEDRIPGWTETASGTLLDSYWEPEPELDQKAKEKSKDVPGWSNTASGTLTDSYVTPQEAQAKLDKKLADEQAAIEAAIASGKMTPEQAKQLERAKMAPEERAYLEKVEQAQADLEAAQASFDGYRGMIQVQAAQDSRVILDGVAELSSHNNVIEDAIDGVDLTLKGRSKPDQVASEIDIEYDRDRVRNYIEQFVSSYNQFYQVSKDLGGVDPRTGSAGPLSGDSIVRSAESRLKSVIGSRIEQAPPGLQSLTEFGITTTRQGTLEINHDLLDRQLNNNFNQLAGFFGGNQGFAKKMEDAIQGMTGITGSIRNREKSLTEQNYRLQDDQAALDRRMSSLEQRTHAKFSAMQDATSKMQSQLAGMMNALG
ncbi:MULTISPECIES: flagellar filament capping protein FliD [Vibrio]|uniref:Flagellar hook-associated protein 2 n=2 Tax=Vibrio TaxID=662 RepID=U2ZY76_VIBPR|nr:MULTISPECIES: flagellar filament capping protein FliD [Vibrio]NAW59389.1 flagellar filament capping protein FliD [Vibrio sp. V36_P2S2PM302]NAX22673.1 flagellar filament capping protein FliD [Vibrio sp. V39_P1S14PM300]NAX24932.1 flagellar filament capping protein FliD [Vibrio sp. V38_P2S17PM301]NAX29673.1 flagellar filament capping protein FliD [Vibrio sp. V37_P2S8PM304]GAD66370.1 flagellar hook-associated protein 2 [Vibrio proteolyticus NBRC 13287]